MTLANRGQVEMYWNPARRRIIARATCCARKLPLPEGALLIGTYAHPFSCADFIGDLDDMLAELDRIARLEPPPESTQADAA